MSWPLYSTRPGQRDAGVPCPTCGGPLQVLISCLSVRVVCGACHARHELTDLARSLDDDNFERLERAVGGRTSDRV